MPAAEAGQPVQAELAPAPPTAPPAAMPAFLPPTVPVQPKATQPSAPAGDGQTQTTAAPSVADDGDLIEKEWVMKAKQIVARTRNDPHKQTKELHAFKADYMKKRYNKTIQAVEE
jgi:hypothetical protein